MSIDQLTETSVFQNRFRIIRKLGEGGMGAIYLAEQLDAQRHVALKLLHPSFVQADEFRKRFQRECSALSRLSNEHILTFYYAAITDDGQPYAAFEYLNGETLRQLLNREGKLEIGRTVRILKQICSAISAAHEIGIVHRDLKPENVMILDKPEKDWVKVLDFGLSKESITNEKESQRLTLTGDLVGTANYMSPEQCSGRQADERSDIYAIGCIAFECLAGKQLFFADNPMAVINMHANETPVPAINQLSTICPPSLMQLMSTTLEKDPEKRPASVAKVIELLSEAESEFKSGITSSGKLKLDPARQKKQSLKVLLITTPLVILLAAGLLIGLTFQRKSARKSQLIKQGQNIRQQQKQAKDLSSLSDMIEEAKEYRSVGQFKKSADLCAECLNLMKDNDDRPAVKLSVLHLITENMLLGGLGNVIPYVQQMDKLINSPQFAAAPMPESKRTKKIFQFLTDASVSYANMGNSKMSSYYMAKFWKLAEKQEPEARMKMSVLMAESLNHHTDKDIRKALDTNLRCIKLCNSLGAESFPDVIAACYTTAVTDCLSLKTDPKQVKEYAHDLSRNFDDAYPASPVRTLAFMQILAVDTPISNYPQYKDSLKEIAATAWKNACIDKDLPLSLRTQAMLCYLKYFEMVDAKGKKAELAKIANDYIKMRAEIKGAAAVTQYPASITEAPLLLEKLLKDGGQEKLAERVNLASSQN